MTSVFTSRDLLTGHLAALIPALPQATYQATADGLQTLGWRPPADLAATLALMAGHAFVEDEDGDGWTEPRWHRFSCLCRKAEYAEWTQRDPQNSGLSEFLEEGHYDSIQLHNAHLAAVLLAAGGGVAA
jgi:hypothetical protein